MQPSGRKRDDDGERGHDEPSERRAAGDEDLVTCFVTGRRVRRADAVEVRLGPGQRVWIVPELCREREPRDT